MTAQREKAARSVWWRRGFWMLLALAIMVVFLLDQGLKAAPHNGFAPMDSSWHAATADLPRFWGELEGSEPAASLRAQVPQPTRPFEVAVHHRTGVRPTPVRWAVWMGRQATVASNSDGWGICARPGILLTAYHALRRVAGARPDPHGVYPYADLHYGWRDGFLIVSTSSAYVAACLEPNGAEPIADAPSNGMRIRWQPPEAPPLEVSVYPRDQIRLSATVAGAFEGTGSEGRPPSMEWPGDMVLTAGAVRPGDLVALAQTLGDWAEASPRGAHGMRVWSEVWQRWALPPLDADWDREVTGLAVGFDLAFHASPVPEVSVVAAFDGTGADGPHPLVPWLDALAPIPYEWNGVEGRSATLLGDSLALCLAGTGPPWFAASNEPLMAGIAGQPIEAFADETDVFVIWDWSRTAAILRQGLVLAARNEGIPGHDGRTIDEAWGPWLEVLAAMGTMDLVGRVNDGALEVTGTLTSVEALP